MTDPTSFAKLMPGFDFLQGLVKNAGSAVPNMGQWIAPTMDPAELERRIQELKTVQFWLEQNARMISSTVQALEVQRMTLSTLHTMNVPMANLQEALTAKVPGAAAVSASPAASGSDDQAAPGAIDPMQWWNALTQQFTHLAGNAMQAAGEAAQAAQAAAKAAAETATQTAAQAAEAATAASASVAEAASAAGASVAAAAAAAAASIPVLEPAAPAADPAPKATKTAAKKAVAKKAAKTAATVTKAGRRSAG